MPTTKRGRTKGSPSDVEEYDEDNGFVVSDDEGKPKSKRSKATNPKSAAASKPSPVVTGGEGSDKFWELSHGKNTRRVGISEFKGTRLINIREYYQNAAGDFLPGKKGISLPLSQYKALLQAIPDINASLVALGETIETNTADLEVSGGAVKGTADVGAKKAKGKEQKANIDETSDEDGGT